MAPPPKGRDNRPPRKDPALAARRAAVAMLDGVIDKRQTLEIVMSAGTTPALAHLSPADRAYAGFLVRTTLRRKGQIDALIEHCLDKPLPKSAQTVFDILRLGATQLLFSETAPHAAVSTTVDLTRELGLQPFAKLANAVMRRLQRDGAALLAAQDEAVLNTPDWLFDSWQTAYGEDTARAIAAAHLTVPPVDLTAKADPEAWAETLGGTLVLGGTIRLADPGDITALAGFEDGAWWVQDAAARLPVAVLGDIAGKTVIDLCAAPGGKTLELAAAGASVTAVDISDKRLVRVRENLARTQLQATLLAADAKAWQPDAPAEIVVLDAPCSSTGTMRRHPDVGYLKSHKDIRSLGEVQAALLVAAARMVAPGGTLLFCTCSLQPAEGPEQIEAFLAAHPDFARNPIGADEIGGLAEAITKNGDLRTLPTFLADIGGMDGFFASRLIRRDA